MISSMTGFGAARTEGRNLSILVEIKSVNHRYMDLQVKLPGEFQRFEDIVRRKIADAFKRGRIEAFVRIEYTRDDIKLEVNHALIRAYADAVAQLKTMYGVHGDMALDTIAQVPGLVTISRNDLSKEEVELVAQKLAEATNAALSQLRQMRMTEAKSLMADIDRRIATIYGHIGTIMAHANDLIEHQRKEFLARMDQLRSEFRDQPEHRIEAEAILCAERSDIEEEAKRLRSHLEQFAVLRALEDEVGKRMDFILQEMNRDCGSIISKTSGINDGVEPAARAAVDIRIEIEKLREQVQNIE